MPSQFRLHEHNFQNAPGDAMDDMSALSKDGWKVNTATIGFPYIHVLWEREVGEAPSQAADHSTCRAEMDRLAGVAAQHEGAGALLEAAKAHQAQLEAERDQAREVARQLKADKERAETERDQLRAQIIQDRQEPSAP